MNCEIVQRRLLNCEKPDAPPADVRRHLAECPSCRVWQRRLVQIEQQLPLIATPPSQRKAAVARLLQEAPEPAAASGKVSHQPRRVPFVTAARDRGLLKASVAIAIAAALVVFALGAWLFQYHQTPTPARDPLAARHADRDRRLREAPTSVAKVETLADLANGVHKEALALAAQDEPEKLVNLARFYAELVGDDLPAYANRLDPRLRVDILKVTADRLEKMESALEGMAAVGAKQANKAALHEMAVAARTSHDRLLKILHGEA